MQCYIRARLRQALTCGLLVDRAFFFTLLLQEMMRNRTALASELAVRGAPSAGELEYIASRRITSWVRWWRRRSSGCRR